jgi:hypothetical protein
MMNGRPGYCIGFQLKVRDVAQSPEQTLPKNGAPDLLPEC